jgi:hypothetical protein
MITMIPSAVVTTATGVTVATNRRRKARARRYNFCHSSDSNASRTLFFGFVGFLVLAAICSNNNIYSSTFLVANAMAPPYPELVEESRKHRALHESSIFPNNATYSYFSLPVLPSGIWEPASDFKKRRRIHNRGDDNRALTEDFDGDEICRYLDADECNAIEESFVRMGAKTRSRIVAHTGQIQSGSDGDLITGLRTANTGSNNNNDDEEPYTLRTLVILVAWKDQTDRREWMTRDQIDHLWNGLGANNAIPTGSIKNYTERQAYGTVNFVADVLDWQITDNTEAYYADGRSAMPVNGDREPHLRTAFHYILDQMDEQNFPWEDYDSDNDGIVDSVQFLHSGFGAEMGGKGMICSTDVVEFSVEMIGIEWGLCS